MIKMLLIFYYPSQNLILKDHNIQFFEGYKTHFPFTYKKKWDVDFFVWV